jgi:hypothetical protein
LLLKLVDVWTALAPFKMRFSRGSHMHAKRFLMLVLVVFVAAAAFATTTTVTTLADSGAGSLRDAITQANNGTCNKCFITFSVTGDIALTSALPPITANDVTIDGYTAPGASPNSNGFGLPDNAVITIGVNGQGVVGTGFDLEGNHDQLRGVAIFGFTNGGSGQAIVAAGAGSIEIFGNFIGTDRSGNTAMPNDRGIVLDGVGAHATIGTSAPADRNLISGNNFEGVLTRANAVIGRMVGNYVGVSASINALGNSIGISLLSHNQRIGDSSGGNLVSGNRSYGIFTTFGSHVITRNLIGTNGSGTAAIPNAAGIYGSGGGLSASTIGGNTPADGNTISGNSTFGIRIDNGPASVLNNRIGVGSDGSTAVPNGAQGVFITGGSGNVVGSAGSGNSIAYNAGSAVVITGAATANIIRGNAIFLNGGGIDLGGDGPTANDANDSDSGPNQLQNWPSPDAISLFTTRLEVVTSINSSGASGVAGLIVDVYKADTSINAEGLQYLGTSGCLAANTLNGYTFNVPPTGLTSSDAVVLTATSYSDGACTVVNSGTSEFSGPKPITPCTPPPLTITPSASRICVGTNVTLDAGAGFASYLWSTGQTTQMISVAPASTSTYSVTVISTPGCAATASTTITVDNPPNPAITAAGPTTFCAGGSVTLNASGGGSLQWALNGNPIGGANGTSYVATAAGNYTLIATNGACVVTSSPVAVTVNSFPSATVTAPAVVCANGGGTASVPSASGASYNWSVTNGSITSGQGTNIIAFAAGSSGSVTVSASVTTNGCTSNGSANVPIDALAPVITPAGPTTFCAGGSVTLNASGGGSLQWALDGNPIGGANGTSYVATAAGNYTLIATNGACVVTSSPVAVTVNSFPSATVTAPAVVCANGGGTASVPSASGASYHWTVTNGSITSGQGTNIIAFAAGSSGSGSVTVSASVTTNGCTSNGSANVPIDALAPVITPDGPTSFCAGGSVNLTASPGGLSYQWLADGNPIGGANGSSFNATASGAYSVTVTDGNGCSVTSPAVNVTSKPLPSATITAPASVCANTSSSASVLAQSGAQYTWSITNGTITAGQGTDTITFSSAASGPISFGVTVTLNGCSTSGNAQTAVGAFVPSVSASGPTSFCSGGSVTLTSSAASSYQWLKNGLPIGQTGQTLFVNAPGNYSVSATDGTCSGTSAQVSVIVNSNPSIAISGPSSAVCPNTPTVLTATNGFASYHWSTGANTRSITVTLAAAANYSVTGVDANGCSATANIAVNVAPVGDPTITAPSAVAAGQSGNVASVAAGPAGTAYAWSINNGSITAGNGTRTITWNATSTSPATITIIETTGACSVTSQANVPVTDVADLSVSVNAPATLPVGAAFTITMTASNAGPSNAVNPTISMTLPTGFGLTSVSSNELACTPAGNNVSCTAASAAVGGLGTITIHATAPLISGLYDLSGFIFSSTADAIPDNNTSVAHINVGQVSTNGCSTVAPRILTPADGANGVPSRLTVVWSATPNATQYELYVGAGNAAPSLAATTTDTFATVLMPAGLNTAYVLASFGDNCPPLLSARNLFHVAASTNCVTAPPTLLTPIPGSVAQSPAEFTWKPVNGASTYRVWVSPNGNPYQDVAVTDSTSVKIPLPGGEYGFYVEAIFPGCDSKKSDTNQFAVALKDPCADRSLPLPTSPFNNSTSPVSKIIFEWAATPNASGYRVWISVDGSPFASLGTTQALSFPAYIGQGTVDWYVEALFDGCASTESTHMRVTVPSSGSCGSELPVLLGPANGVVTSNHDIDFRWSAVPGAVAYELWVALADNSATLMGITESTGLTRSLQAGTFDWFVRAIVSGCAPRDSHTSRFTYALPAGCVSQRPVLTLPVDDSRTVIAPVDFHWSNVPGAVQYDVWVSTNHLPPFLIGSTTENHLGGRLLSPGPVEWYVVAVFNGCPSMTSTTNVFTIVPGPSCGSGDIPSLRAPSEVSSNINYHIRWSSIGTAQLYEVEESLDHDFGGAEILMTQSPEMQFVHTNNGAAAVPYFYRVRTVSICTGARSLFSPVASVSVLPSTTPSSLPVHAATPADDRQTLHSQVLLGGAGSGGSVSAAVGDSFVVTTNVPWLTVTPSTGTIPPAGVLLNLTMDPSALPFGVSSGDLIITTGAKAASQSVGRVRPLGDPPSVTTNVSVNVVQPVASGAKNTPAPDSLIFAAVAHAAGGAQSFLSDVRVTNTSPQVMKYQLIFTPTGEGGISASKSTTINVEPGRTSAMNDVLATWFGVTPLAPSASGALEVRPVTATTTSTSGAPRGGVANAVTFAASRLYSLGAKGSFGQYVQPNAYVNFISRAAAEATSASALTLQQTAQSATRHTNLGLIEGSGDPATVLVSVFNDNGQKLKEFTQSLKGGQNIQLNSVLTAQGVAFNDGRIETRVSAGNGKITTYASVIEDSNGDALLVSPVSIRSLGATRYVVPGVAQISSDFANWRTDVRVFNGGTDPVSTNFTYFPQDGPSQSQQVTIQAKEVKTYDSALQSLFGVTSGGGTLHIDTASTSSLVATARTYNQTPSGTIGQFVPAATLADSAGSESRSLQLIELEESSRFRTNVGLAEMSGNPVQVQLTIVPPDGKVAATTVVDLPANGFRQFSQIIKSAGFDSTYDVRISAKVISGTGRITAYASVIDMSTGDPTFIPAQ